MNIYVVEVLDSDGEWRPLRAYDNQRAATLYAETCEGWRCQATVVQEVQLHVSEDVKRWEMEAP